MGPAILVLAAATALAVATPKRRGKRSPCPPNAYGSGELSGYKYIEFAIGGAPQGARLPLIIFCHSRGTNPAGMKHWLESLNVQARVVMPIATVKDPGPIWWRGKASDQDQKTLAAEMRRESRRMAKFVQEANRCLGGVGKPIVTGHSQGGMMALAVATAAPGSVRAAIPVSAWIPVELWPRALPPTKMIHGGKDTTVTYARTADFVERANGFGLPIGLVTVPNNGHGFQGLSDTWRNAVESVTV